MSTLLFALLSTPATAQSLAELVDGTPEFQESCLDDTAGTCEERFLRFLTHSMVEQGFTFQHVPLLTTPLANQGRGLTAGAMLDTFPLTAARSNLAGKQEETDYSPVLPRVVAGWLGEAGDTAIGAGAFFLPPIEVKGASALVAGADLSASRAVGELRLGAEADFTYTRAMAPIVASEEQYANREEYGNNLQEETYEEVCAPRPDGCVDTFTVANTGLRLGVSYPMGDFTPHLRLGAAYVHETLYVMYDDTTWLVSGMQYSAHLGGNLLLNEKLALGLGTSAALRPARISEDEQGGVLFKIQGAASWVF
jgi:hypothetical protein